MKLIQAVLAFLSLSVVLVFCIAVNYRIGYFYWGESGKYLVNYLEDKPVLVKLFDYHQHDADLYRPRELGNVFNLIDAYILLFFASVGLTNFLSPVHFLSVLGIVLIPVYLAFKEKKYITRFVTFAVLVGILFLTSPQPFMTAYYFRTSKSIVSLFIAIYFLLIHTISSTEKRGLLYSFLVFLLTFAMGIIDEMGIIMAGMFFLYLIIMTAVSLQRKFYVNILTGAGLGIVGIFVYRLFISPEITFRVLGERPAIWGETFLNANSLASFPAAVELLFSYLGSLTGGVRGFVLLPILLGIGFILTHEFYRRNIQTHDRNRVIQKLLVIISSAITLIVIGIVSLAVLVMITSYDVILWEELRLIYYPLPFVTLWFLLVFTAGFALIKRYPKSFPLLIIICIVTVIINVVRLSEYQQKYLSWWKVKDFPGAAFPLIKNIDKETISASDIESIDGKEAIYIFRKKLGRKIIP